MGFINGLQGLDSTLIKFIISVVTDSVFLATCVLLVRIIFKTPMKSKKWILVVVPITIFLSLIYVFYPGDGVLYFIISFISVMVPFAETVILFKKPPVLKVIGVVFAYGIIRDIPERIICIFLGKEKEDTISLCTNLLFFLIILFLHIAFHNKNNPAEKLSYLNTFTYIWVFVTVICFALTFLKLIEDENFPVPWLVALDILLLVSFVPYIVNSMLKAKQSEAYFRRALDAEIRQFEIIGEKEEDLRRFRHDYANHMRCIAAMIDDGQADGVKAYVEKLGVDLQNTTRDYYTGNYMLDIILAEKRSAAKRDGNDVLFEGSFPKSGIKNDDICTIMANALDNAIEACSGTQEHCVINIKSILKEDQVVVSITNPVENKVHVIGGSIATSKADKSRHGYGLRSIKKTVAKYDGYIHLSSDHQTFELLFSLKLQ